QRIDIAVLGHGHRIGGADALRAPDLQPRLRGVHAALDEDRDVAGQAVGGDAVLGLAGTRERGVSASAEAHAVAVGALDRLAEGQPAGRGHAARFRVDADAAAGGRRRLADGAAFRSAGGALRDPVADAQAVIGEDHGRVVADPRRDRQLLVGIHRVRVLDPWIRLDGVLHADAVAVGDVGQALGRGDGVGALVAAGRRRRVPAAIMDGVDAHAIVPWKRTRAPAMLVRGFAGAIWGFPQLTGARLSPSPPQSAPGGPGFLLPAATAHAPSPRRGAARWQRPPADW